MENLFLELKTGIEADLKLADDVIAAGTKRREQVELRLTRLADARYLVKQLTTCGPEGSRAAPSSKAPLEVGDRFELMALFGPYEGTPHSLGMYQLVISNQCPILQGPRLESSFVLDAPPAPTFKILPPGIVARFVGKAQPSPNLCGEIELPATSPSQLCSLKGVVETAI